MRSILIQISILNFCLLLSISNPSQAATEQRLALVIGNSAYASSPLANPVNDATDIAASLTRLGFTAILKKNATHRTMEEAIRDFGQQLKKQRGVGLFFYAGHGIQMNGVNYLIPIGANIQKETDVQFEAVNVERILVEIADAENRLNIVILDACRENPFRGLFRSPSRGLAIISNAPTGTFISYSTAANQVAFDGSGRNSPYTEALLKYINEPGLSITDVFIKVRQKVRKETGQVPWELSSLEGEFFFAPGKASKTAAAMKEEVNTPSAELEVEQKKIDEEREKLRREKELLEQKEAIAREKREVAEREKQLATLTRPSASAANEIKRDNRFIAYDDGTVLDTKTNLMWAARDNGTNISSQSAKDYCETYRGGGYTDWRMPTQGELAGLYDATITNTNPPTSGCSGNYHLTNLINLTCCCAWSSETKSSGFSHFNFGGRTWLHQYRALPVRTAK